MKRLSIFFTLALTMIFMTGSNESRAGGDFTVVATTPELASIASVVLGTPGAVYAIARPDEDPHYVQAKPSQMVKLRNADAIVYNGLELEIGWLSKLLEGARNPAITAGRPGNLDASKAIKKILEVPAGEVDRSKGDIHPNGNPHYLMNPYNGISVAKWMAERFGELDKANAQKYAANASKFESSMMQRISEWERRAQSFNGLKVIAYHNTWPYLADWLHIEVEGFIEDRPGIPPTPRHIMELTHTMKNENIRVIITQSFTPIHAPENLARATGAKVVVLPSTVTGQDDVSDYPSIFEKIVVLLSGAS